MDLVIAGNRLSIEVDRVEQADRFLAAYLAGDVVSYHGDIDLADLTVFQQEVITAIKHIPYGETRTYGDLAARIGRPAAYRAVANACGANPVPVIVPCHRVVAQQGVGGYSGGIAVKQELLAWERAVMYRNA